MTLFCTNLFGRLNFVLQHLFDRTLWLWLLFLLEQLGGVETSIDRDELQQQLKCTNLFGRANFVLRSHNSISCCYNISEERILYDRSIWCCEISHFKCTNLIGMMLFRTNLFGRLNFVSRSLSHHMLLPQLCKSCCCCFCQIDVRCWNNCCSNIEMYQSFRKS